MGISKFSISEMPFSWVSTADTILFHQNTCKTGNNAIETSQAFCDLARFEGFTDLNLFKYAFNIIQTGKLMLYKFYFYFLLADSYGRRR